MVAKLLDFLHGLVEISGQGTGQIHLISEASYVVMTFSGQYHNISSIVGLAQKVSILGVLHLVIFHMTLRDQSFSCSLNHLSNTVDTIGILIYDHPHVQEIGIPLKQPWGSCFP
jgi:hypothetical protein